VCMAPQNTWEPTPLPRKKQGTTLRKLGQLIAFVEIHLSSWTRRNPRHGGRKRVPPATFSY